MKKTLDDFSKNLASGMSRRKAFTKFLAGAGVLGFLGRGKVKAQTTACGPICLQEAMAAYQTCLESRKGAPGSSTFCFQNALGPVYQCCLTECETHGSFTLSGCEVNTTSLSF